MEIERKFLIKELPDLSQYEHHDIEQGYLSTKPVLRIRKKDDHAFITIKGGGMLAREEHEFQIPLEEYDHLLPKIDGRPITKTRYIIPFGKYTIELDVFKGHKEGLIMAEVEFESLEEANSFVPPEWFGEDVTMQRQYHNSQMI